MATVWAFIPIAFIFGITPGPDAALSLRSSLTHGVKHGVTVAVGAATGSFAWGIAAAAGVATFVTHTPTAFEILRWAGAIYLGGLGVQSIVTAGRWNAFRETGASSERASIWKAFQTGLIADLLNPKMGVFYIAVIPQFIPKGTSVFLWSMVLMTIEFTIAIVCLSAYAILASFTRSIFACNTVTAWMERILGVVLLGFGARVAIG